MAMRHDAPFPDRDPRFSGQGRQRCKSLPVHVLRIGDSEREAAAANLGDHYVAGRLTLDELHERLSDVFAARTAGQLWKVMADLPGAAWETWWSWQAGAHWPAPWSASTAWPAGAFWQSRDTMPIPIADAAPPARRHDTASDRAGRFAALSLLVLAMLIWLFTALLFARHGFSPPAPGTLGPPHG
ncbi:MAG TPA: DUF1707 domain-containing protein [Trebonia sp.]|jgi:hypothetical protein